MQELFLILVVAGTLALGFATRRRYELVRRICRQVCKEAGLQLLDDSVAFRKRLQQNGRWLRAYTFEWSRDRQTRQSGTVWLDGEIVEYLSFDEGAGATLINAPSPTALQDLQ